MAPAASMTAARRREHEYRGSAGEIAMHKRCATAETWSIRRSSPAGFEDGAFAVHTEPEPEQSVTLKPRKGVRQNVDEKVLRRRMQYKLHQRRHRAKQKERTSILEGEVSQLADTVSQLEQEYQVLQQRNVFHTRGMTTGVPVKIAMEYFRLFEHGFSGMRGAVQEQFLRSVMCQEVEGPDYRGVDILVEQWQLYGVFFVSTKYVTNYFDVSTVGDMTVIVVDVTLLLRPRRDGVTCLLPNLLGNEDLIQEVVGRPLTIPGKVRFMVNQDGSVSWLGAEMDFVVGLQRSLGSLQKVATFMHDANISFCTGQIARECHVEMMANLDRHCELQYVL